MNFVKDNFVGVGVMRTKCLECEASTYTKETFTNIDIPILGSQEAEEEESSPSLFTSQILSSEILRSDNKYWCSECRRLNEAQRSVSYEVLPTVLVLQLKRFTTVASKTYVSKLTDFIPTPFTLDCFCTECSRPGPGGGRHRYRLYSVILHLGASLASGHYIAYVRAGDTTVDYLQCKRPGSADTTKTSKKRGLFKMFSKSSSLPVEARPAVAPPVCPSLGCCGLKVTGGGGAPEGRSSPAMEQGGGEDCWLECDDEQISVITRCRNTWPPSALIDPRCDMNPLFGDYYPRRKVFDRPGPDLWRGGAATSGSLAYLAASSAPWGEGWGWGAAPSPLTPTSLMRRSWRARGCS